MSNFFSIKYYNCRELCITISCTVFKSRKPRRAKIIKRKSMVVYVITGGKSRKT